MIYTHYFDCPFDMEGNIIITYFLDIESPYWIMFLHTMYVVLSSKHVKSLFNISLENDYGMLLVMNINTEKN